MQDNREKKQIHSAAKWANWCLFPIQAVIQARAKYIWKKKANKTKSRWKQNLSNFISEAAHHPEKSSRLNTATVQPVIDILKSS